MGIYSNFKRRHFIVVAVTFDKPATSAHALNVVQGYLESEVHFGPKDDNRDLKRMVARVIESRTNKYNVEKG